MFRHRNMFFLPIIALLLSGPVYSRNLLHREFTPVWVKVDSKGTGHTERPMNDGIIVGIDDTASVHVQLPRGDSAAGSVCHAGDEDAPILARELQDERLLTWCHLDTSEAKRRVLQAIFEQPVDLGQAVFDFLVYSGECFAPRGETRLELFDGTIWRPLDTTHLENWSQAETIGRAQHMGRVRWIYNLEGRTCSGFRMLFSDGVENSVICTDVSAFNDNPIRGQARGSEPTMLVAAPGDDLLPFIPYEISFFSYEGGRRTSVAALPLEFRLHPNGCSVSAQLEHPLMMSRVDVKYQSDVAPELAMEMFLEGQRVTVGMPELQQDDEGCLFTLTPVAVDRIDLTFSGKGNGKVNLLSLAVSLDDAGRKSLQAIADSPHDKWAERLLAVGEPNYTDSAAFMLPRRDHRTVVGCPDDGDETGIEWNGTMFLRRRGDPRGSALERFLAFRLDGENFGEDFNALRGGWTDGTQELSPGSLPERWIRYDKDGVSATVRSFGGVNTEGEGTHLLWVEVSLQNHSRHQREGSLKVATGLRRSGKSGSISLHWDLPVFDEVALENERLLVDALGHPILLADSAFRIAGSEAEPACRFDYRLAPGVSQDISLVAMVDCEPDKSHLPRETLAEARDTFARFWNRKLASGMKITIPEQRLQQIYPHFLAQCLIIPDRRVPVYGSFFYEDTLCVEEVWPTVALAQFGFLAEAHAHAQSMLKISAEDNHTRHKQYRKGLSPACAWSVYQYSRDRDFLQRVLPLMRICCEYIIKERRKTMALHDGGKTGYYGLLPRFVYGGDISEPAYGLYANACAWRGLRDSSLAANALGETALAGRWREEADNYRRDIMAVIERVTDRESIPVFTPLSLGRNAEEPDEAFPIGDATPQLLHQDQISSYWALFAALFLETGLLEPTGEYTTGMLETYRNKAGLWDGQVRFAYVENNWDPHYGYGLHRTWQRRDERNLFLTAFYGFLANNMSRDSWVHGEVTNVFPLRTQNFAQQKFAYDRIWRQPGWKGSEPLSSGPGIMLSDLRDMLVYERRDESDQIRGGLSLLRFAPGNWFVDGTDIVVEDAPTTYGNLSYRVHCELERRRSINISLDLDNREPVLVRVYAFPSNLGNLLEAKWSSAVESAHGANWVEAKVQGRADVTLQF